MIIRLAQRNDLPALVKIYNQAILAKNIAVLDVVTIEERRPWLEEHQTENHPILVAQTDSLIQGYVSLSAYRPGRRALNKTVEVSYFVDLNYHRQGVGSRLLEAALKKAPAVGIHNLFAILLETNVASVGLLEKFGFEQWALLPQVAVIDDREVGHVYYGKRVVE